MCKLKRQSADDDGIDGAGLGDGDGVGDVSTMLMVLSTILMPPMNPPNLSNPQSICHHC